MIDCLEAGEVADALVGSKLVHRMQYPQRQQGQPGQTSDYARLLVVIPNWVGDVVLATPALRAIRRHLQASEITYLMRSYVRDVLHNCPWADRVELWPEGRERAHFGLLTLAGRLRRHHYTAILLLTNSFRTALLARLVGAARRVGYARDYRSFLLTDRLDPGRRNGHFAIESMLTYYGRLAGYVGCSEVAGPLELHTDAESDSVVEQWWQDLGIHGNDRVVLLNPGAAFGASKLYPIERFARVGTLLAGDPGCRLLITAGPGETAIAKALCEQIESRADVLLPPRLDLRRLKSVVMRSHLLITNDTGPRHFAIAFHKPVVTIFGPTHPEWTETHHPLERKVLIPVECGPCQKPLCPLDHRCMTGIAPEAIVEQARQLLVGDGRP